MNIKIEVFNNFNEELQALWHPHKFGSNFNENLAFLTRILNFYGPKWRNWHGFSKYVRSFQPVLTYLKKRISM